eukprot:s3631_g1.t1
MLPTIEPPVCEQMSELKEAKQAERSGVSGSGDNLQSFLEGAQVVSTKGNCCQSAFALTHHELVGFDLFQQGCDQFANGPEITLRTYGTVWREVVCISCQKIQHLIRVELLNQGAKEFGVKRLTQIQRKCDS